MAVVTFSVRTFGLEAFPADERLLVSFIPSGPAFTSVSAFPGRTEHVEPDAEGFVSVDLAPTLGLRPEVWYTVRFEWFERHPVQGWIKKGSRDIGGKLRVPAEGGTLGDLLDAPSPPGVIRWGRGAPPSSLKINEMYVDISGMKLRAYAAGVGEIT